ncbi:Thiolase-like, subgroup, partial [Ostreococcus tauri]
MPTLNQSSTPAIEFGSRYLVHFAYFIARDAFDHEAFAIIRREAQLMDPQQRVLLENAFAAVRTPTREASTHQSTAVAVGAWTSQYADLCRVYMPAPGPYSGVASALSVLCGRVSYTFGLRGPSVCVDTACSSSLVAAHTASAYLRGRECDDALVAGVSVNVGVGTLLLAAAASMLSYDGRCKTLDASADGYAKGECCVVLRVTSNTSLDVDALARDANDPSPTHIALAQLEHTGVNQDGRSSSLTAPNGPSQQALMADVLVRAGLHARTIGRLEMHGTGTS